MNQDPSRPDDTQPQWEPAPQDMPQFAAGPPARKRRGRVVAGEVAGDRRSQGAAAERIGQGLLRARAVRRGEGGLRQSRGGAARSRRGARQPGGGARRARVRRGAPVRRPDGDPGRPGGEGPGPVARLRDRLPRSGRRPEGQPQVAGLEVPRPRGEGPGADHPAGPRPAGRPGRPLVLRRHQALAGEPDRAGLRTADRSRTRVRPAGRFEGRRASAGRNDEGRGDTVRRRPDVELGSLPRGRRPSGPVGPGRHRPRVRGHGQHGGRFQRGGRRSPGDRHHRRSNVVARGGGHVQGDPRRTSQVGAGPRLRQLPGRHEPCAARSSGRWFLCDLRLSISLRLRGLGEQPGGEPVRSAEGVQGFGHHPVGAEGRARARRRARRRPQPAEPPAAGGVLVRASPGGGAAVGPRQRIWRPRD